MYKPLLSEALGHESGPAGLPVPKPGKYFVRPAVNLYGMGVGAREMYLETGFEVPPGHFWQEIFTGPHLSVDYSFGSPVRALEGFKENGLFVKWVPSQEMLPLPEVLMPIMREYPMCNVEYIGGNAIEAHFRGNPDPQIPVKVVWEGEDTPESMVPAYEDCNGWLPRARLGFVPIK